MANSPGRSSVILAVISPSLLSIALRAAKKSVRPLAVASTTSPGISTLRAMELGTVNSGTTTSKLTITAVTAVPSLPAPSVAVNVSWVVPKGNMSNALLLIAVIAPSTLSEAEADAIRAVIASRDAGTPSDVPSTVSVAATLITGAVWSVTVTVEVTATAALPAASAAVKVIRLAPIIRVDGALFATVTVLSTLSKPLTEARKLTTAALLAGVPEASTAATVIESGAVSTGIVWSVTVTVVLAV